VKNNLNIGIGIISKKIWSLFYDNKNTIFNIKYIEVNYKRRNL